MTNKTHSERLYVIETKLDNLIDEIKMLKESNIKSNEKYTTRDEFNNLKYVVYGSIGFFTSALVLLLTLI